jgi:hypothetical protein
MGFESKAVQWYAWGLMPLIFFNNRAAMGV